MTEAILLTLELALVTTLILLVAGTPLAWWLARTPLRGRPLIEALIALPLVLPPTVLGFYLLVLFDPVQPLGRLLLASTGSTLAFHFHGLVFASVIYSLPFVVQPLQAAFATVPVNLLEAAATLGAKSLERFAVIVMPLCWRAFIAAATLGFAHTVGEFGVVLMIGGAIPGETKVLAIALFDEVEALRFDRAHQLAAGLMLISVVALTLVYRLGGGLGWQPRHHSTPRTNHRDS